MAIIKINEPVIISKITKRAFMQRFTLQERTDIRNSTDPAVIDIYEDLKMASNVDLKLPELPGLLNYLVSTGLLDTSRVAELLVQGTKEEAI
jgi:hypothetical protein